MIIDDDFVAAANEVESPNVVRSPVLVYLMNEIQNADDDAKFSMYSVAAGVEFDRKPPFGPFEYVRRSRTDETGGGGDQRMVGG